MTPASPIVVTLPDGSVRRFSSAFLIGRDASCELQIIGGQVSRRHAEIAPVQGQWVVRDLQSSNGTFVDGERIETAPLSRAVSVTLGADGPTLMVAPEGATARRPPPAPPEPAADVPPDSLEQYAQRYFNADDDDESVGGHTLMIRKAFQQVQQRQKRRTRWMIATAVAVAAIAGVYAIGQHQLVARQEDTAETIFYRMKVQDLRLAQIEQQAALAGTSPNQQVVAQFLATRRQMESDYESYAQRLYDRRLNEKDRLILRVTRQFGECELAAPPDYIREVHRFIQKWQSTGRFTAALKRARDLGYTQRIVHAFESQGLPPQYFYLAMQESDFDTFRSGPPTRWGIAKGMWQFIPETAEKYGLKIGPLYAVPRPDPIDERLKWEMATNAAAHYIKDIYATDAQASGLLVMASYNWGERRVIDILRTMPADPRQRNFWQLLAKHGRELPDETYNYVFYIVSAAVIGENPRLFGFPFDNPLQSAETH